jgi:UPF0271 protein
MTTRRIDLNADVGELPVALLDGSEEQLVRNVTSVNIACGGHAGDTASMEAVVRLACHFGTSIGAHPSYPDRDGFGRRELKLPHAAVEQAVRDQVQGLARIAERHGVALRHVKPHGALYNVAVHDAAVATAIARGVWAWRDSIVLVGLAGSDMLQVWTGLGFQVAAEAFADRRYEADGSLRRRSHADAVLHTPEEAAAQALDIVLQGRVVSASGAVVRLAAQTLCVHGDTPGAVAILMAVRRALENQGVAITAFDARTPPSSRD